VISPCRTSYRCWYEKRPALDEVVQFMAGLAYMTGPPGQPLHAGASVIDILGGVFGVRRGARGPAGAGPDRPRPAGEERALRIDRIPGRPAHGGPGHDRRGAAADAGAPRRLGELPDVRQRPPASSCSSASPATCASERCASGVVNRTQGKRLRCYKRVGSRRSRPASLALCGGCLGP
jgi:CoA-transferase family III